MQPTEVGGYVSLALQAKEIIALIVLSFIIVYTYVKILPLILFHKDQRLADTLAAIQVSIEKLITVVVKLEDRME